MFKKESEKGIIGWLLLIIIALALLKYFFDFSIFDAASSEQGMQTIEYVKNIFSAVWNFIRTPVLYIWDEILRPIFSYVPIPPFNKL